MLDLAVDTDDVRGVSVMKVEGRVDSDSAPKLDEALSGLLKANCNKIVVNLGGVEFLSSAGLRALVKAYQGAQKAGGSVRLTAVPESIQGILFTVGLNQMLNGYPTDQEALASF